MAESKIDNIDEYYTFFNAEPIATFVDQDGSLSKYAAVKFDDIAETLYSHQTDDTWSWDGEALFHLKNGNFAYLTAYQDTTFDGTYHFISESLETLFTYAMSPEESAKIKESL